MRCSTSGSSPTTSSSTLTISRPGPSQIGNVSTIASWSAALTACSWWSSEPTSMSTAPAASPTCAQSARGIGRSPIKRKPDTAEPGADGERISCRNALVWQSSVSPESHNKVALGSLVLQISGNDLDQPPSAGLGLVDWEGRQSVVVSTWYVVLASFLKPPYLLPTSTSTVRSTRLSERTTASLKKDLTNTTSGLLPSAPTMTVFWIFSTVLVVRTTRKPLPRSDRPTSVARPFRSPPL